MKNRRLQHSALLVLGLLLIGMSIACYVWVRKEQRQYALNRDLIAALISDDKEQALVLVEAGADPNTRQEPTPAPSLPLFIKQLLHPAPLKVNTGSSAFSIVCGAGFAPPQRINTPFDVNFPLDPLDSQLTQAMLLHGANVDAKDGDGATALHMEVMIALLHSSPAEYNTHKEIITQLLNYGADPDEEDKAYPVFYGSTPMKTALASATLNAIPHPDLVALLRKYRKHP